MIEEREALLRNRDLETHREAGTRISIKNAIMAADVTRKLFEISQISSFSFFYFFLFFFLINEEGEEGRKWNSVISHGSMASFRRAQLFLSSSRVPMF